MKKVEQLLKKSKRCSVYCITDDSGEKRIKRDINGDNAEVYDLLRDNPHKFMPKIFSVSEDKNDITVIEEFVDGDIISEACFSENQMLKAAKELCAVLIHIHSLGIIHRDIKPSNILMTPSGQICLIDFEAARKIKP
ncbi:MAG: protein kinase, partial [Oscillospiraceae bacterium]|nr:protein kinase [Oscillospiraceae bacterium]